MSEKSRGSKCDFGSNLSVSMPSRSSSPIKLALPAWSDTNTCRRLPTNSGSICSYVLGSFSIADA